MTWLSARRLQCPTITFSARAHRCTLLIIRCILSAISGIKALVCTRPNRTLLASLIFRIYKWHLLQERMSFLTRPLPTCVLISWRQPHPLSRRNQPHPQLLPFLRRTPAATKHNQATPNIGAESASHQPTGAVRTNRRVRSHATATGASGASALFVSSATTHARRPLCILPRPA